MTRSPDLRVLIVYKLCGQFQFSAELFNILASFLNVQPKTLLRTTVSLATC